MADDEMNRDSEDRPTLALSEQYQVAYFAARHGISQRAAKEIIAEAGSSRSKADDLVRQHADAQRT